MCGGQLRTIGRCTHRRWFLPVSEKRDARADGVFRRRGFGRGYGEENDLCRRATALGWRNIMAADVFVRHTGEVSFAASAKEAQRKGMRTLLRKHPDYMTLIRTHADRDPAAPLRRRIDARRFGLRYERNILFVSHTWGGGIERHIRDMSLMLEPSGVGVIVLRPRYPDGMVAAFGSPEAIRIPRSEEARSASRHGRDRGADASCWSLSDTCSQSRRAGMIAFLMFCQRSLPKRACREFTFHDFMAICPRII